MWNRLVQRLRGGGLRPLESRVLDAVAERLEPAARERFLQHVALVNTVQRHAGDKAVNLYQMRGGKAVFDDALRFPLDLPEAPLATVAFAGAGKGKALRAEVWLANGRVFSIEFNRPPAEWSFEPPAVAEVTLLADPMRPPEPASGAADLDRLRQWLGPLAERGPLAEVLPPPSDAALAALSADPEVAWPADVLALFRLTGGFRIGEVAVHGPSAHRSLVLDAGRFLVLAEHPDGRTLALSRDERSPEVVALSPDDPAPVPLGRELRPALERLLPGAPAP